MTEIPPIKAVMTPFPYWIDIDAPVREAAKLLDDHGIRHLPVVERGNLVAVMFDSDVTSSEADGLVRDVCRRGVCIVNLNEPLDRVLMTIADHPTGCALVVKDDKLAGIFTLSDASRRFGALLRTLFPRGNPGVA